MVVFGCLAYSPAETGCQENAISISDRRPQLFPFQPQEALPLG